MKHRKKITFLLVASILVSLFPLKSTITTAEAAIQSTSCPFGGSANEIGQAGCVACGGSGKLYDIKGPGNGANYSYNPGTGYNIHPTLEIDADGNQWALYYRCYNCGDTGYDCKQYTELIKKVCVKVSDKSAQMGLSVGMTSGGNGGVASAGYVPIRWCSFCGPHLKQNGESYETVAKWAQYHQNPEPTPVSTYTLTVSANAGGKVYGDSGTYEKGAPIFVQAEANAGYEFSGWSGAGSLGVDANSESISFRPLLP